MANLRRVLICTGLAFGVSWTMAGSAVGDFAPRHSFEVAVLAIPSEPLPNDVSQEVHVARAWTEQVEIAASANTSLTCDGCTGEAASVQVIYAGTASTVIARNVATAWASGCAGCRGWAVSIQVVLAGPDAAVTAANRALALNVTCLGCEVSAAALQFIVSGDISSGLSRATLEHLESMSGRLLGQLHMSTEQPWRTRLGTMSRASSAPERTSAPIMLRNTSAQIAAVLSNDLGAEVTDKFQVSQG